MWFGPNRCIDPEFDEPDVAADHDLCRAIATGRWGLHPEGWGNHDPVPLFGSSRLPKLEPKYTPPIERKKEARPPPPRPRPRPPLWTPSPVYAGSFLRASPVYAGELQLTCDECSREAFDTTLKYVSGQRDAMVAGLRALGAQEGWTCIVGRDRCPHCSELAAPEAVGNGTGAGEGHKQHADGG
jgi:hypothetical protein